MDFDPYEQWLGIPAGHRPPEPRELLGIPQGESDAGRIRKAAAERYEAIRPYAAVLDRKMAEQANHLLTEIAQAVNALAVHSPQTETVSDALSETASLDLAPSKAAGGSPSAAGAASFEIDWDSLAPSLDRRRRWVTPWGAGLAVLRAADAALRAISGRDNVLLHHFMRCMTVGLLVALAVGVSVFRHGEHESDPPAFGTSPTSPVSAGAVAGTQVGKTDQSASEESDTEPAPKPGNAAEPAESQEETTPAQSTGEDGSAEEARGEPPDGDTSTDPFAFPDPSPAAPSPPNDSEVATAQTPSDPWLQPLSPEVAKPGAGVKLLDVKAHASRLNAIAWDPESNLLAAGGGAGAPGMAFFPASPRQAGQPERLAIWDVKAKTQAHSLAGHMGAILAIAWHPTTRLITTGSLDGTVRLWSLRARDPRKWPKVFLVGGGVLAGGGVLCIAWHENGTLVSGLGNGTMVLAHTDRPFAPVGGNCGYNPIQSLAWQPPESMCLAVGDTSGSIWVFDFANKSLVCGRAFNKASLLSTLQSERLLMRIPPPDQLNVAERPSSTCHQLAWSPDGGRLAAVESELEIWRFDTETGLTWAGVSFRDPTDPGRDLPRSQLRVVDWHPSGDFLAAGGIDNRVCVWSAADGSPKHALVCPAEVTSIAWSPDGESLAAGCGNGSLLVWASPLE